MDNKNQAIQIPPDIKAFIEGLLNDSGMQALDDDLREEMIKELYVRLDNFITATIIDKLPAENADEFIKMNEEKKSQEEVEKFLKEKIPNAQEMLTQAFADFRQSYLGDVTLARNAENTNNETKIDSAQPKSN